MGHERKGRILALDGLRGVAAAIVVAYHYLCFLHPKYIPDMTSEPVWFADLPIAIFWNGPFAVSIFFVLSGFVLSGAASRRHKTIISNLITRYIRLALPATVSVIFAWALLSIWPTATSDLAKTIESPSPWLEYTYQSDIPSFVEALRDGLIGIFAEGGSAFNNVLWTMRVELIGSVLIFGIYWIAKEPTRLVILGIVGFALLFYKHASYSAFILGAILHEIYKRGGFDDIGVRTGVLALLVGISVGALGEGAAERFGLPITKGALALGEATGLMPVIAAGLILFAVLTVERLSSALSVPFLQWLGRISFSLYLVHVPMLYTIFSVAIVERYLTGASTAIAFAFATLAIAHVFTRIVDEPSIRLLRKMRATMPPMQKQLMGYWSKKT